jgi:2-phospho-L-lactate/phosphoenolpyruvate guanylyltransferase
MNSYVVIPVRELSTTKLRLESILTQTERIALTRALLNRVLTEVDHSSVDRVVVVASDIEQIDRNKHSKLKVISESHAFGGVNLAMQDGLAEIGDIDAKSLLIPSDLPLLDGNALNGALSLLDNHDLIICPSRKRDGTNLLGFVRSGAIPLHYDDDSFTKHLLEAEANRLDYLLLDSEEFSFDLDDVEDLKDLQEIKAAPSYQKLLEILGSR